MNTTIVNPSALPTIDDRIAEITKERDLLTRQSRKLEKTHSKRVPIEHGPDRGYFNTVWDDEFNEKLYNGLANRGNELTMTLIKIRRFKKNLIEADAGLTDLLK